MDGLKLKIPPPIVALIMGALMWLVARMTPSLALALPASRAVAGCIFLVGLSIAISGVISFRRARTTVNPMKPDSASSLVTSGIYRYTRNPMYLGLSIGLLAWAVFLSNPLALLVIPAFVLYMNRLQIEPEEAALEGIFGPSFIEYRSKVRRWM